MTTAKPPLALTAMPEDWPACVRQAVFEHEGVHLRAHPALARIQVWSLNKKRFCDLMLPGGAWDFETAQDRDAVIGMIVKGAV